MLGGEARALLAGGGGPGLGVLVRAAEHHAAGLGGGRPRVGAHPPAVAEAAAAFKGAGRGE